LFATPSTAIMRSRWKIGTVRKRLSSTCPWGHDILGPTVQGKTAGILIIPVYISKHAPRKDDRFPQGIIQKFRLIQGIVLEDADKALQTCFIRTQGPCRALENRFGSIGILASGREWHQCLLSNNQYKTEDRPKISSLQVAGSQDLKKALKGAGCYFHPTFVLARVRARDYTG